MEFEELKAAIGEIEQSFLQVGKEDSLFEDLNNKIVTLQRLSNQIIQQRNTDFYKDVKRCGEKIWNLCVYFSQNCDVDVSQFTNKLRESAVDLIGYGWSENTISRQVEMTKLIIRTCKGYIASNDTTRSFSVLNRAGPFVEAIKNELKTTKNRKAISRSTKTIFRYYLTESQIYQKEKNYEKSYQVSLEAKSLVEKYPKILLSEIEKLSMMMYNGGVDLYEEKKYNQSIKWFSISYEVNEMDPEMDSVKQSRTLRCLSLAHLQTKRYELCLPPIQKALQLQKNMENLYIQSKVFVLLGKKEDAHSSIQEMTQIVENKSHLHQLLDLLKFLGSQSPQNPTQQIFEPCMDGVVQKYEGRNGSEEEYLWIMYKYVEILVSSKCRNYIKGKQLINRLISQLQAEKFVINNKIFKEFFVLMWNLGLTKQSQGEFVQSVSWLQFALQFTSPEDDIGKAKVLKQLAHSHMNLHETDVAVKAVKESLRYDPQSLFGHFLLFKLYCVKQETKEALQLMKVMTKLKDFTSDHFAITSQFAYDQKNRVVASSCLEGMLEMSDEENEKKRLNEQQSFKTTTTNQQSININRIDKIKILRSLSKMYMDIISSSTTTTTSSSSSNNNNNKETIDTNKWWNKLIKVYRRAEELLIISNNNEQQQEQQEQQEKEEEDDNIMKDEDEEEENKTNNKKEKLDDWEERHLKWFYIHAWNEGVLGLNYLKKRFDKPSSIQISSSSFDNIEKEEEENNNNKYSNQIIIKRVDTFVSFCISFLSRLVDFSFFQSLNNKNNNGYYKDTILLKKKDNDNDDNYNNFLLKSIEQVDELKTAFLIKIFTLLDQYEIQKRKDNKMLNESISCIKKCRNLINQFLNSIKQIKKTKHIFTNKKKKKKKKINNNNKMIDEEQEEEEDEEIEEEGEEEEIIEENLEISNQLNQLEEKFLKTFGLLYCLEFKTKMFLNMRDSELLEILNSYMMMMNNNKNIVDFDTLSNMASLCQKYIPDLEVTQKCFQSCVDLLLLEKDNFKKIRVLEYYRKMIQCSRSKDEELIHSQKCINFLKSVQSQQQSSQLHSLMIKKGEKNLMFILIKTWNNAVYYHKLQRTKKAERWGSLSVVCCDFVKEIKKSSRYRQFILENYNKILTNRTENIESLTTTSSDNNNTSTSKTKTTKTNEKDDRSMDTSDE